MKIGQIGEDDIELDFWKVAMLYLGITVVAFAILYSVGFMLGLMFIGVLGL